MVAYLQVGDDDGGGLQPPGLGGRAPTRVQQEQGDPGQAFKEPGGCSEASGSNISDLFRQQRFLDLLLFTDV